MGFEPYISGILMFVEMLVFTVYIITVQIRLRKKMIAMGRIIAGYPVVTVQNIAAPPYPATDQPPYYTNVAMPQSSYGIQPPPAGWTTSPQQQQPPPPPYSPTQKPGPYSDEVTNYQ